MVNGKDLRLEVSVSLYGQDGTRIEIREGVDLKSMSFAQLSRLLEAFHILTEAIQQGREVSLNGQELRYFS
jgi:hypothetical protein